MKYSSKHKQFIHINICKSFIINKHNRPTTVKFEVKRKVKIMTKAKSVENKENVRRNVFRDCRLEKVPLYKPAASPKKNRKVENLKKFIDEMRCNHAEWQEKMKREEAELDARLEEELRQFTIKIEEESRQRMARFL